MKCPKCGSKMFHEKEFVIYRPQNSSVVPERWECRICGHDEKVGGEKK